MDDVDAIVDKYLPREGFSPTARTAADAAIRAALQAQALEIEALNKALIDFYGRVGHDTHIWGRLEPSTRNATLKVMAARRNLENK